MAFVSTADNLVPDDLTPQIDLFVVDRALHTVRQVNVGTDGSQANQPMYLLRAAISGDGAWVAFMSGADNLMPGDTNNVVDAFVTTITVRLAGTYAVTLGIGEVAQDLDFGNYGLSAVPAGVDLVAVFDTGVSDTDDVTCLDNSTSSTKLQFDVAGTVVGATVTVYAEGVAVGSAVAAGATTRVTTDGTYDLADGVCSMTARQTETGKTESGDSPALDVTVDTRAPRVTLTALAATSNLTPWVKVRAVDENVPDGTAVTLDVDLNGDGDFLDMGESGYVSSSLVGGAATFSISPALTANQNYQLEARVSDAAGNEGSGWGETMVTESWFADNGDLSPVYTEGGTGWVSKTWHLAGSAAPYNGDYRQAAPGSGANTATWTVTGLAAGDYEVFTTWSRGSGRASNTPYKVWDGAAPGTLRLDVTMNQKLGPNDVWLEGRGWELLGSCTVQSGTLTVQLSDDADGKVVADVIWVSKLPVLPQGIVDNRYPDPDYVEAGSGWWTNGWHLPDSPGPYYGNYRTHRLGDGSSTATWTLTGVPSGTYEVLTTWTRGTGRATSAPFKVYDGAVLVANQQLAVDVNQRLNPNDAQLDGCWWESLGVCTISSGTVTVQVNDAGNGNLAADAIWVRPPSMTFVADYTDGPGEGFNDPVLGAERRAAFEYGLSIWAGMLGRAFAGETITVDASMRGMGGSTSGATLGLGGPTFSHSRGSGPDTTYYGSALFNHLEGSDPSPDDEIEVEFNSDVDNPVVLGDVDWYYGLDANPPHLDGDPSQRHVDFVTVVVHEIAHGLNFLDAIDPTGAWTFGDPGIYGRFLVENQGGIYPALTTMNDAGRAAAITNGNLFWDGSDGIGGNYGLRPKLHAPELYEPGSSVSHLDGAVHRVQLMSPTYDEADHTPSPMERGMMADMGWTFGAGQPVGGTGGAGARPAQMIPAASLPWEGMGRIVYVSPAVAQADPITDAMGKPSPSDSFHLAAKGQSPWSTATTLDPAWTLATDWPAGNSQQPASAEHGRFAATGAGRFAATGAGPFAATGAGPFVAAEPALDAWTHPATRSPRAPDTRPPVRQTDPTPALLALAADRALEAWSAEPPEHGVAGLLSALADDWLDHSALELADLHAQHQPQTDADDRPV